MESLGDDDVSIVHARKYEMVRMTQRILWHLLYSHISILFCVTCVQWYSVEQLFWKIWTKRHSLSKNLESLPDTSLSFTNFLLETICQTPSFLLGQRVLYIPSVSKSNNMLVICTIIISFFPLPPPPPPLTLSSSVSLSLWLFFLSFCSPYGIVSNGPNTGKRILCYFAWSLRWLNCRYSRFLFLCSFFFGGGTS